MDSMNVGSPRHVLVSVETDFHKATFNTLLDTRKLLVAYPSLYVSEDFYSQFV